MRREYRLPWIRRSHLVLILSTNRDYAFPNLDLGPKIIEGGTFYHGLHY